MATIKMSYDENDNYYCLIDKMRSKAGSYAPTMDEINFEIYPNLQKYIEFLMWIEQTGYDTEENKKARKLIKQILIEEIELYEGDGNS